MNSNLARFRATYICVLKEFTNCRNSLGFGFTSSRRKLSLTDRCKNSSFKMSTTINCYSSSENESFNTGSGIIGGYEPAKISSNILPSAMKTKFFKLSHTNDNEDVIESCVRILHRGGIVALPTDTLYGVACLAQSTEAVEKLYEIKARNPLKPVAICVGDLYKVCQWTRFPQGLIQSVSKTLGLEDQLDCQRPSSPGVLYGLLEDLLPGPVTIVTERSPSLNNTLNPKTSLVGIRVPDHKFIKDLTNRLREPLALTSANVSGEESSLRIEDFRSLWPKLDAVVDDGEVGTRYVNKTLQYAKEGSTVVQILNDGVSFKILRPGCAYENTVSVLKCKYGLKLTM
uniref:yrdC domain-containing protein, mitochondrial n=1 Tax=Ciona intestinalis TaxID=7719 RepID=UPI00006A4238|nr:yrdC domain-containing protein, mitochondrial [Ciona intestinalis]|eukprot:XP_002131919.2 yrdC domain-containing protein, mitochondrial [Ciona intestinalis]